MPRRRIFISHSSPREEMAGAGVPPEPDGGEDFTTSRRANLPRRLGLIDAALQAAGYETWIDRRDLEPGDEDWYRRVATAMATAHGALLLFDERAASSRYVQHEASVLRNRVEVEGGAFRFLPAILRPDLKNSSLAEGSLRASKLDTLQTWRASQDDAACDGLLAARIAEQAKNTWGEPVFDATPRERLISKVERALEVLKDTAIEATRDVPGVPHGFVDLVARVGPRRRRAALARWLVGNTARDMDAVVAALKSLADELPDDARASLRRYLGFAQSYWLAQGREACPVSAGLRRPERKEAHDKPGPRPGGVVVINGGHVDDFTAECFGHIALAPDDRVLVLPCDDGARSVDAVAQTLLDGLNGLLEGGRLKRKDLGEVAGGSRPVICVLPPKVGTDPADTLASDLAAEFKEVLFVLWPGDGPIDRALLPAGARPVDPDVPLADEAKHRRAWLSAQLAL